MILKQALSAFAPAWLRLCFWQWFEYSKNYVIKNLSHFIPLNKIFSYMVYTIWHLLGAAYERLATYSDISAIVARLSPEILRSVVKARGGLAIKTVDVRKWFREV